MTDRLHETSEWRVGHALRRTQQRTLAVSAVVLGVVMLIYEAVKTALWPGMTLWESHAITIVFATSVGTIAVLIGLRRQSSMQAALLTESFERRRLMELSGKLAQHTVELEAANTRLASEVELRVGLERQLVQAQKMESLGRIAGGLAHDFNNVLSVVLSSLELADEELREGHPARVEIVAAQDAAQRAARLTRQLLSFARHRPVAPDEVAVNELIRQAGPMLQRAVGAHHALRFALDAETDTVRAVASELEQMLLNLVINAVDAISGHGEIVVSTSLRTLKDHEHPVLHAAGEVIQISVRDSGSGIAPHVLEHLFEPFFTTKPEGKGTGLGLATTYAIAGRHGGLVEAFNNPDGPGATFRIWLPTASASLREPTSGERPAPPRRRVGRILLAEDQEDVRRATRRILERGGHLVVEAEDGEVALRLLHDGRVHADLLLTDVVMPRLGGRALADEVRASWPQMPILFLSGYTDEAVLRTAEPITAFLQKPFGQQALLSEVDRLLGTAVD